MKHGLIKAFGIYLGTCSGHACFEHVGTPMLVSHHYDSDIGFPKTVDGPINFSFSSLKLGDPASAGIPIVPLGKEMVARCNAGLAQGKSIHVGFAFTQTVQMTLGADTRSWKHQGSGFGSPGSGLDSLGVEPLKDVDSSKTVSVQIPVVCEPVPEMAKTPPTILEAALGVTTSGNICPKPSTARVIIAAEAPRDVFYKIERADGTTTTADWIQGEIKISERPDGR